MTGNPSGKLVFKTRFLTSLQWTQKTEQTMKKLKPKEQHERLLANEDKAKIVHHLSAGEQHDVIQIGTALARQCNLFVHFQRLWLMRVSDLDEKLGSERYMQNIYLNRRTLNKQPTRPNSSEMSQPGIDLPTTDTEIDG
jgi:hypothetical protein